MNRLTAEDTRAWILRFATTVDQQHHHLTDLDRQAGDGDFGTNLRSALGRATTAVQAKSVETPQSVFAAVADAFLNTGGTSGPLFGMWFRQFAKAAQTDLTLPTLARAATEGVAAVMRLGKAEVGHKTMVDAMAPAAAALASGGHGTDPNIHDALRAAAAAARAGAEATEHLAARRGRASYVAEQGQGVIDPGAMTVALFFEAATNEKDSR